MITMMMMMMMMMVVMLGDSGHWFKTGNIIWLRIRLLVASAWGSSVAPSIVLSCITFSSLTVLLYILASTLISTAMLFVSNMYASFVGGLSNAAN